MKHRQQGNATVILVIAAVVCTVIGLLLWERSSLTKEVKNLGEQLVVVKRDRDDALERVKELQNDLETQRDLAQVSQDTVKSHVEQIKTLQMKLEELTRKFPKPKPKSDEAPQTVEDLQRSQQRIETLWEIYCLDPIRKGCIAQENKK